MDAGHEETEVLLKALEEDISAEYDEAIKEIEKKIKEYWKSYQYKDQIKLDAYKQGKISYEEYYNWRVGQLAIGERWEEMRESLLQDFYNAGKIAENIINGYSPDVYALNHNYGTFQVEKMGLVDTSYTLYNGAAVEKLYRDGAIFYPAPGKQTQLDLLAGKMIPWDRRQVQSVLMQGIIQGESIGQIATRLAKTVGENNRKVAIRNARTITTGVEAAGRIDAYKRAEGLGVEMMQEWLATLDGRTRHEHRLLDGQRVKVGEPFKIYGEEIRYPGDPTASPYLVYNCRCTVTPVLKKFEIPASNTSLRANKNMKETTYYEWKTSKDIHSDPITKQDEIAERMKRIYNNEYKKLKGTKV